MNDYLYLGNLYGASIDAAPIAYHQLSQISPERWNYYFKRVIQTDQIVLLKMDKVQVERFSKLLNVNGLTNLVDLPKRNQFLYTAIIRNDFARAKRESIWLYENMKKKSVAT